MSVIVKGIFGKDMPMPQEGYIDIRLHFKGGRIECATMPIGNPPYYATLKVVELPPHGRLIDTDKLKSRLVLENGSNELKKIGADILKWIDIQETVIEGGET